MKRFLIAAALAISSTSLLATDVGVSVSIGQPGFYGRLDIGDYPQPQVIYQQPRYIYRAAASRAPIYLRVPPGHARNWRKHCHRYDACGERVYFVQDNWYQQEYVPRYQERDRRHRDDRRDGPRGNDRNDRDDRNSRSGNDRNDNDHGNDHGNGRGKDKNK